MEAGSNSNSQNSFTDVVQLIGTTLLKKKGLTEKDRETTFSTEEASVDDVKSATFLALLFSAGYCPPCKFFLATLKDFYSDVNVDKKVLEIVYVPLDKSEDEFKEHYAQMPWLALPYRDERIARLKESFKVVGIPILVVVDSVTGFPITTRGRKDIHEQGSKTVADWTKLLKLNRERELKRQDEEVQNEILRQKLQQQYLIETANPVVGVNLM